MTTSVDFVFDFLIEGTIWKVTVDVTKNNLVLEVRDKEKFQVTYYEVDLINFSLSGPLSVPQTDWWTTLLTVSDGLMFLERYVDPQDPLKKELIVYAIEMQKVILTLADRQLITLQEGGMVVRDVTMAEEEQFIHLEEMNHYVVDPGDLFFPQFYENESTSFETVRNYLDKPIVLGCEYWEKDELIVISYYTRNNNKFVRSLLMIKDGKQVYHEIQDQEMDGFASGSFFICQNLVVFIKNGSEICGMAH